MVNVRIFRRTVTSMIIKFKNQEYIFIIFNFNWFTGVFSHLCISFVVYTYRICHQNPDKFQFKFIVPPPEVVVGVQENLMFLVNNHIFKMTAILKPSAEYNILNSRDYERPSRWALSNGNNSVLWIPEINHLCCGKIYSFKTI